MKRVWITLVAMAVSGMATIPANATVTFATGNKQYQNVNIAADTNALSIVGDIGNTGDTMTFEDMLGPDCTTQVSMHGQHGVAFVESTADSLPGVQHTGFCSITLMAEPGTAWTAGDFKLDLLAGQANGDVTFTATDQFGNLTTATLPIDVNGQNPYQFTTAGGEQVTQIVIQGSATELLQDIKQVSLHLATPFPEPLTLSLFGAGLAGIAGAMRRKKARKSD